MRKASKILCLVGGILGLVLAVLWLGLSIFYFVTGGLMTAWINGADLPQATKEWLANFASSCGYYYAGPSAFEAYCYSQGATFLVMFLFSIPSAIISFILSKKEKTGLPLPIVCVVLSWAGNLAAFAGGALAIVNWAIVERKEGEQKPEEKKEEPKEEEKAE